MASHENSGLKGWKPDQVAALLVSGFGAMVAILEMSGLASLPWVDVPKLTLLFVSLIAAYSVVEARSSATERDRAIRTLQADMARMLEIAGGQVDVVSHARQYIHPVILRLFGDRLEDAGSMISRALKEGSVRLHDVELFRHYYRATLLAFPKARFYATSIPEKEDLHR